MKRILLICLLLAAGAVPAPSAAAAPPATPSAGVWHINGVKAHYDTFEVSADGCQYRRLALSTVQNAQRDGASTGYQTIVSGLYLTSNMCDPNGRWVRTWPSSPSPSRPAPSRSTEPSRRFASPVGSCSPTRSPARPFPSTWT